MFSAISTLIFGVRNFNRARNGEDGRAAVAGAQGASLFKEIAKYDNMVARGAKSALNLFNEVAKDDKVFKGVSKVVRFASENVNPLIVVSSGINVIKSDDKQSAIIAESGNLAGMFAMEGWMAKNLDKHIQHLPINKKWIPVVRGITFVFGSIGASTVGHKIGSICASKLKEENEKAKANLSAYQFVPQSIAYKA